MVFYKCRRCNHETKQKIEMIRHLNRKIKCIRSPNSFQYTDDEINNLSLEKLKKGHVDLDKNKDNIENNTEEKNLTEKLSNEFIPDKNIETLIIQNYTTEKKDLFICKKCNKSFTRKFSLERHENKCSYSIIESTTENNTVNNIVNNTNNTINAINTINNNNIQINLQLEAFDNDWDVSKINKFTRHSLLLSKIMYTNLLQNILDNETNLNVIIEKESNVGIVYKNDVDKFIKMKLKDIVDNSMDKLNKHLKNFYNESKNDEEFILMDQIFEDQKNLIDNKYNEYKDNEETQKKVEEYITDIYDKKKEDAIKLFNHVLTQNNQPLLDGF